MLGGALVENILCLLAYNEEYAGIVRNSIPLNLYGGPYRIIAGRCYDFLDNFHKPPGDHVADLLEDKLKDEAQAPLYEPIIRGIRKSSDDGGQNIPYVIDSIRRFIQRQSLRTVTVELTKCLQQDTEQSIDRAQELINSARTQQLSVFDPGTRLSDRKALNFFNSTNESFPTGIKELDQRGLGPNRKELHLLIANIKTGKCIAEGEFVLLADGRYLPIEQITTPTQIVAADGVTFRGWPSSAAIFNGAKPVVRVTTRSGRQLTATKNHPLLTKNGWLPIEYLHKGDKVAVPAKLEYFGSEIEDKRKLRFLGYMIADGGMSKYDCSPTFSKTDMEVVDDMKTCLGVFKCRLTEGKKDGNYWVVSEDGVKNNAAMYLRNLGLMGKKSKEKTVPNFVFQLHKEYIAEFLKALFVCDGSITRGTFEYSTTSRILAFQVAHLLLRFGVVTKIRERHQTVSGRPYVSWILTVSARYFMLILRDEIKIPFGKGRLLKKCLEVSSMRGERNSYLLTDLDGDIFYDEIVSIEEAGGSRVYDLSVPDKHNFVCSDFIVHNSWWLTHLAKMSVAHRLKVVHITLEMSEDRVAQRYFQALYGVAKRRDNQTTAVKFKQDDAGRINGFGEVTIQPKVYLSDPDAYEKLEKIQDRWKLRHLSNVFVKQFPTGKLTVPEMTAYLDSLEATQRFVPDLLIIDYPDLMKIDTDNARWSLDAIYKDIRGIAVERNIAVSIVTQSNRLGAMKKQVETTNASEAYSKNAHADVVCTLSATAAEKRLGLARMFVAAARNDADSFTLVLSQHYKTGVFSVDSHLMDQGYWQNLDDEGGDNG